MHRIGGCDAANLALKPQEKLLHPPGVSVLCGGTPSEAAEQMRAAFADRVKFARIRALAQTVASTTCAAIVQAGFQVDGDASAKFPNHARVTHADGISGFSPENLNQLAAVFRDIPTPG